MLGGLAYANEKGALGIDNRNNKSLIIRQEKPAQLYLKVTQGSSITLAKFSLTESSNKPKLANKGLKKSDERFTPTETISEDLSVSFPVDI